MKIYRNIQRYNSRLFWTLIFFVLIGSIFPTMTGNGHSQAIKTPNKTNNGALFPFDNAMVNFTQESHHVKYQSDNETIDYEWGQDLRNLSLTYTDVTETGYTRTSDNGSTSATFKLETGDDFWIPLSRLDPELVTPNITRITTYYGGNEPIMGREYLITSMTSGYEILGQQVDAWIITTSSEGEIYTGNWTLYFSMEKGVLVGASYYGIGYPFILDANYRDDWYVEWTLSGTNLDFNPPDLDPPSLEILSPKKGNFHDNVIFNISAQDSSLIYRVAYIIQKEGQNEVLASGKLVDLTGKGYYTGVYRQSLKPGTYNLTITVWDWKLNSASSYQKMRIPTPFLEQYPWLIYVMGLLLILVVIAIGIGGWRLYFGDWKPPTPFQIYVINDMGLSVFDRQYSEQEIEAQLISGFLTAISSFMSAITVDTEEKGNLGDKAQNNLKSVQKGNLTMQLEWGKYTAIACMIAFESYHVRRKLRRFQGEFEKAFKDDLEFYMGDITVFEPAKMMLDKVIMGKTLEK